MNIDILTAFFMWCTIINLGIYVVWILFILLAPDFIYRVQTKWIPISQNTFTVVMYSFMGAFKLVIIVFCFVPYISLLIIR
ncbi:MAG: hypothetical protein PVH25_13335 [Burkholderiales bacterium]